MDEVSSYVRLAVRSSHGKAVPQIVPPYLRIPRWKGPSADSEEKREPASDIDTAQVNSLKVLDPEWPIREANMKRLAKPLATSVRVMRARSSSLVMCPTVETCAPVAHSGVFLVMVVSLSPSHARRMSAERVLPCRSATASALANSGSTTMSRLSLTPASTTSSRPPLLFHSLRSSRTSLIRPSPDDSPPFTRSSTQ